MERACKICKRLNEGRECIICKSKELTRNWKGVIIIFDPETELAKMSGHTVAGRYALQVIK